MKILVTGGAGYIGSIVVEQLMNASESVVVFDSLYQGHRSAVHPDATFVEGDLADRASVEALLSEYRPEAIMHFASHTLVGESMEKPFVYLGENVTNGLNLLQSAVQFDVRRFILSSTANLFDAPKRIPIDIFSPFPYIAYTCISRRYGTVNKIFGWPWHITKISR